MEITHKLLDARCKDCHKLLGKKQELLKLSALDVDIITFSILTKRSIDN